MRISLKNLILPASLIIVLIIGLFIGQFASNNSPELPESDPSKLEILFENQVDLGTLWSGEVATRNIQIRNQTDNDINVTVLATSCGCTEATMEANHLNPGTSASLQFTVDTTKKSGTFTESIKLGVSESDVEDYSHSHSYTVELTGETNVQRGLTTTKELSFGNVRRGMGPVALDFKIVTDIQAQIDLEALAQSIETSAIEVKIWQVSERNNSAQWNGTVILDPDKTNRAARILDTKVLIPVLDASNKLRTLKLKMRASLDYMVDCSPHMLYWPASERNILRILKLTSATGNSVKVVDVQASTTPFLAFEVKGNDTQSPYIVVKCNIEEGHSVVRTEIVVVIEYGPDKLQQLIPVSVLVL